MSAPVLPTPPTIGVDAGFSPGLPAVSLCGFTIPSLAIFLKLNLPPLPFDIPPKLPSFPLLLQFDCNGLHNPLDVTNGLGPGGGRTGIVPHDPDNDYD